VPKISENIEELLLCMPYRDAPIELRPPAFNASVPEVDDLDIVRDMRFSSLRGTAS